MVKNRLHEVRQESGRAKDNYEEEMELHELLEAIARFKKKNKKVYEFITKAGSKFVGAVFN